MVKETAIINSIKEQAFEIEQDVLSERPPFNGFHQLWRLTATGLAAASFLSISFFLAAVVFPLIRFSPGNRLEKARRIRHLISHAFAKFLKCCTRIGLMKALRVSGAEHLEEGKACIIVANHPTIFDVVVLGSLVRDFNCVVKHRLASNIFLGGCVKAAEYVTNDHPSEIVRRCEDSLLRSQPLIIFPEGTRSPANGLGAFSRGAAHLALRQHIPIITAVLKCDPPVFTKERKWYSIPGRPIEVTVEFSRFSADDLEAAHNEGSLSAHSRDVTAQLENFFRERLLLGQPSQKHFRPAILIPNHNHKDGFNELLDRLALWNIDCLIVDDGSEPLTQQVLDEQANSRPWVRLLRRPQRGGKGAAVMDGLNYLHHAGYSHAVQLDADGQHNPDDGSKFLREAQEHPEALILGKPEYGPDVPRIRLAGRQISRLLVWLETLSFSISDPLLGYRVYPLHKTVKILDRHSLGRRMDFDPEIAVRLKWEGVPIRNIPTRVRYPENVFSNFRFVRDNIFMILLHCRLLAGMVSRPFSLLFRQP